MKLYFGKTVEDSTFIAEVNDEREANMEMGYYLTERGYDKPYYWRMWYSEDGSYSIHDFGSWSYFFYLYE